MPIDGPAVEILQRGSHRALLLVVAGVGPGAQQIVEIEAQRLRGVRLRPRARHRRVAPIGVAGDVHQVEGKLARLLSRRLGARAADGDVEFVIDGLADCLVEALVKDVGDRGDVERAPGHCAQACLRPKRDT